MTPGPAPRLVVLVRHAKAESGEEGADHDRRLTGRGERDAGRAGAWLASMIPEVEEVWCSSATRAVQTWTAMQPSIHAPPPVVERDLYLAGGSDLAERINGRTSPGTLVVVGHNPAMEEVQARLTGQLRGMRTSSVVVIDLEQGSVVDSWSPK